jgi:hypothetical protein
MTWTKLPETFFDDPRLLAVSRDARLLHIEALTWCHGHGTHGAIPANALHRLTDSTEPESAVAELVTAQLWTAAGSGWEISR